MYPFLSVRFDINTLICFFNNFVRYNFKDWILEQINLKRKPLIIKSHLPQLSINSCQHRGDSNAYLAAWTCSKDITDRHCLEKKWTHYQYKQNKNSALWFLIRWMKWKNKMWIAFLHPFETLSHLLIYPLEVRITRR